MYKLIKIWALTIAGQEIEIQVPSKRIVCPKCHGEGSHSNPNIDGNGLNEEDMLDQDFMESYMHGDYDVTCIECHGERVVSVPDWDHVPENKRQAIKRHSDMSQEYHYREGSEY